MSSKASEEIELIIPDWPVPPQIRAATTTRIGGISDGPWRSLNLGAHVGDADDNVLENRRLLRQRLALPREPAWLNQVHGCQVVEASGIDQPIDTDASVTSAQEVVCAVMTADCLPVLFCADDGSEVAAAHAGWRGLSNGILEATLAAMMADKNQILAWLGPAIGPDAFEVGDDVRDEFVHQMPEAADAFVANRPGHWLADIYLLAKLRLRRAGLTLIFGGDYCTYTEAERFFSYRRDGVTGRMATLIWKVAQ